MRHPSRLPCAFVLGFSLLCQGGALGQSAPEAVPAPELPAPELPAPKAATPEQATPEEQRPDPPALVGRVARLDGNSHYRLPGQEDWQPAQVNFPVTSGHAIATGPRARAGLQLGSLRLALDSDSRVEFAQADDGALHLVLAQGMLFLAVPAGGPALPIRITTPRGDALLAGPGQMLVQAGAEDQPTRFVLLAGEASVEAEGIAPITLAAGQAVALDGTTPPEAQREAAGPPPPLVAWAQSQAPRGPLPAAVAGMTGADDLSHHGEWQQSPEYGDVWIPPVPEGWAPYRQGRWSFVQPWGWSWVDDAPWGFAPFHYGRWVEWGSGWAWAPGYGTPGHWPVYAPALVTFFPGARPGWLGWAPLRPWQAYQPPYWVSLPWFRRLNHGHVRDWAGTEAWWRQHRYAPPAGSFHAGGTTLVPTASFAGGRPVTPFAQPHGGAMAGPVLARPGLAPAVAAGVAAGVGAALLAPRALASRALAFSRPALPPAMGPRPAPPLISLSPSPQRPALPPASGQGFRAAPAPSVAGKQPPMGSTPWSGGPPRTSGGYASGKPGGGYGGPAPRGNWGGNGGGNGGGYAAGKPGGWGGPPSGGHFSAPPPSHFSSPPQRPFSAPAPRFSPPAQAYNAPSYRAPPAPSYHAPSAPSYRAPSAPSYRAPSAPSFRAPSAPSHPAPSSSSRGGSHHHR